MAAYDPAHGSRSAVPWCSAADREYQAIWCADGWRLTLPLTGRRRCGPGGRPRSRSKRRALSSTKLNDGVEGHRRGQDPAGQARRSVADDRDGLHHRAGATWPCATALRNWAAGIQW
jgi:hypothetical protein